MKQLFARTKPARPGAPRSPAPSENARGVDLSAKIEPFPYTNAPPVITPTQQRNLANMGSLAPATDPRSDPLMTAPERRQSLRARESSDEPWVMINDSIQNPDSRSASIASLMPGAAAPYNSPQFMQASTVVPAAVQSLPSSPVMQQQQPPQPQLQQQQQQQQPPQQPRSQQNTIKRPPNLSANSNPLPSQPPPPQQQQPTFVAVNGHSPQPYPDLSHRGPNPMDRAFVESQENVREGSIHSQQEKSWTRNFFGGSGGGKEKEANAELMRMIGFLTAAAPDDWNLVLEVCERASANENAAKEASRALRREFRYGEPSAQLSAARLWAIMLQNATDTFILQTASRKFLDNLEEVISAETTSPVVRERLLDVLASAAYEYGKKPGKEGFMSLWKRVRPPWKPIEGVPFDPEDMMFDSAFPRRAVPPGQTPVPQSQQPQQQQPGQPGQQPHPDPDRRRKDREREKYYQRQLELAQQQQHHTLRSTPTPHVPSRRERGIIPPEEDIRKLFEECDVARNNAQILSQALTFASPSTLGIDAVIQEFHAKCRASQELIVAQIPWASAGAERSRAAAAAKRAGKESSSDGNTNGKLSKRQQQQQNGAPKDANSDLTKEERLLAALLQANEELIEVFRIYEELEKMAFAEMEEKEAAKRSIVETRIDRTKIDFISPDGSFTSSRQGASSSSRSPSPLPPAARSPPNVTITTSATAMSGKRDLPLPPPSANEHMNPTVNVTSNIPPSHYQQQPSPLQTQALSQQQISPTQSPPPGHQPSLHHAHHASNHSIGGYANLNLPPSAPHGPRHSPSTRSRTPSPDRPGVTANTPPTAVTPAHEYGPPPHPPPHLAARTAGARVDSLRRTESPAPGLAPPGLTVGGGSAGVHNVSGVRIDMEAAKGYMNSDDEDLMTPIRPSEKALGKRRAPVEEPPNEEELERREEAELEEAYIRSTAPPGSELESPKQTIHYVYDAAAERAKELDRLEKEELERERRQREQARNSMQRVPGAGSGGGSTAAAAAAPAVVGAINARP